MSLVACTGEGFSHRFYADFVAQILHRFFIVGYSVAQSIRFALALSKAELDTGLSNNPGILSRGGG